MIEVYRKIFRSMRHFIVALLLMLSVPAQAGEVTVAVASNFQTTLESLTPGFEAQTGHRITIIGGATGKLATQILQAAPFDVFLSADDKAPAKVLAGGKGVAGTEFTYALGALALYSADPARISGDGAVILREGDFTKLAIANPKLAPYGVAAEEVIAALEARGSLEGKIVMGENIGQAFAMAASGNAELGLVALSQVQGQKGSHWPVPSDLHQPIRQNALLIRDGEAARAFLDYLRSAPARAIIAEAGYGLP
jgi:molybdate transport system substrate-binding protein